MGGGIYCGRNSDTIIKGNVIIGNTAHSSGGGIWCYYSNLTIENNIIVQNESYESCGAISISEEAVAVIINNSISDNTARSNVGGIWIGRYTDVIIVNTICWNNTAWGEFNELCVSPNGFADISYSDIGDTLWPGVGNISVDPLFRDPDNGDFHLMSTACGDPYDSPCIDAGDPSIFDYLLDCDWGLGYERSDMGAYGGQAIPTDIMEERPPSLPMACGLLQNYPNPFNTATTLSYSVPQSGLVSITIYNLLGQRVETIFEGEKQAGQHTITWDASEFPSGIYFARLEAGDYSENIKMVLLK